MTTSDPPPSSPSSSQRPRPAALVPRNQVIAIITILLAAAVPLALAFDVDICPVLAAVGVDLDACAGPRGEPALPPEPASPEPSSPRVLGDAGALPGGAE